MPKTERIYPFGWSQHRLNQCLFRRQKLAKRGGVDQALFAGFLKIREVENQVGPTGFNQRPIFQ